MFSYGNFLLLANFGLFFFFVVKKKKKAKKNFSQLWITYTPPPLPKKNKKKI